MKYEYRKQFTVDGHTFEIYAHTLDELVRKRDKKISELSLGEDVTVKEWAQRCFRIYRPNASAETLYATNIRFEKHVFPVIGATSIRNVKPIDLQGILNAQQGKSKSHVDKLAQELKFLFEKAVDNNLIRSNPARNLTKPKAECKKRRAITQEERAVLLDLFERPEFLPFALMYYAGLRPSEAIEVKWDDVIQDGFVYLHVRGTKTANSDRFVPLCDNLTALMDKAPKTGEYVCLTASGRKHYDSSWKRLVKKLKREMDIKLGAKLYRNKIVESKLTDFTPYLLRHTFCSDLQKKGIDVRTAQRLMGHADIRTTVNIYTHQDGETLRAAAEILCKNPDPNPDL